MRNCWGKTVTVFPLSRRVGLCGRKYGFLPQARLLRTYSLMWPSGSWATLSPIFPVPSNSFESQPKFIGLAPRPCLYRVEHGHRGHGPQLFTCPCHHDALIASTFCSSALFVMMQGASIAISHIPSLTLSYPTYLFSCVSLYRLWSLSSCSRGPRQQFPVLRTCPHNFARGATLVLW